MAIGPNDLKPKTFFIYEGQPWVVLETHHLKMQQRRPVVQTRMKNVLNGKIIEHNFAQSDLLEEADVEKVDVKFLYNHRDEYWFVYETDPSKRFKISADIIGDQAKFLTANIISEAMLFNGNVINISLPIKMQFKVVEAPPAIRGDTAQGGVKSVKLETGAYVNVPLFIGEGDVVSVNTETGEYVERVTKG
jgi:elongation factor P